MEDAPGEKTECDACLWRGTKDKDSRRTAGDWDVIGITGPASDRGAHRWRVTKAEAGPPPLSFGHEGIPLEAVELAVWVRK